MAHKVACQKSRLVFCIFLFACVCEWVCVCHTPVCDRCCFLLTLSVCRRLSVLEQCSCFRANEIKSKYLIVVNWSDKALIENPERPTVLLVTIAYCCSLFIWPLALFNVVTCCFAPVIFTVLILIIMNDIVWSVASSETETFDLLELC